MRVTVDVLIRVGVAPGAVAVAVGGRAVRVGVLVPDPVVPVRVAVAPAEVAVAVDDTVVRVGRALKSRGVSSGSGLMLVLRLCLPPPARSYPPRVYL